MANYLYNHHVVGRIISEGAIPRKLKLHLNLNRDTGPSQSYLSPFQNYSFTAQGAVLTGHLVLENVIRLHFYFYTNTCGKVEVAEGIDGAGRGVENIN